MRRVSLVLMASLAVLTGLDLSVARAGDAGGEIAFDRVGTFVVCENTSCDTDVVETTVSEIVTASADGLTLAYADSALGAIGFVDIADPGQPKPLGALILDEGSPTSVAVAGPWLLAAVDTSESFTNPSGRLYVYDLASCAAEPTSCLPAASLDMGGQPDSVVVSPDGAFAAIAIENQRDEDVNDGELPQLPGGDLKVVALSGSPDQWIVQRVDLTGLAEYAPEDPEPEYVSINENNVAAVTLQENNHIVLVDLPTLTVVGDFPAGTVSLQGVDTEDDGLIEPVGQLVDVPREPDAVAWLDDHRLATANEGDLFGGTRGFTVYGALGRVLFDSKRQLEFLAQRHGHYPEGRSDNKGTEPEGLAKARYLGRDLLFVGSERGNFVEVYEDHAGSDPKPLQLLPTGVGPEGLLAIPSRGLFVTAAETDEGVRSQITLFHLREGQPRYPQIVSGVRRQGPLAGKAPIGWVALSALAGDRNDPETLYTAHDAFLQQSRLYVVDVGSRPAVIRDEIVLERQGAPVNYDLEGLVQRPAGGFWLVSEGAGQAPNPTSLNLLVEVSASGSVLSEVQLPDEVNALQLSNGFEGVTTLGTGGAERVYVAFQREWTGDPAGQVRIGAYRPATGEWRFFYYPLDPVESPAGGWVGLSEITAVGSDEFLVLERDNVGGPDARIKRIYSVSTAGIVPQPQGGVFPLLQKQLVADLLPALRATGGWTQEKVEGVGLAADRRVYVVTDNDGVDESTGETLFMRLGRLPNLMN